MIERLLASEEKRFYLSDGARAVWQRIEGELFELEQSNAIGAKFASFCGKMPGLFGRLTLVLSHVAGDIVGDRVSADAAEDARMLILHSAVPHAARVYTTMAGGGGDIDTTQTIAGFILTKELSRLLASDLTRNVRPCRTKALADVQKQVSPLVAGGWLVPEAPHAGNNAWSVNPVVHRTYAERAGTEAERRQAARRLILGTDTDEDDGA